MQLSNIPSKLVLPWATSGNKNNIPVASQIGITAGAASLTDGFPPLTMTPVAAGGVPPSGLDMNGILYEMSTILRWANAGGGYAYDSTFANDSHVGGYPKGARVMRSDGMGYWFNTVDNNTTDPEAAGAAAAGWVPDYQAGATSVAMSGSSVTLTPAQYGKPLIVITGALSANLNLIFPTLAEGWTIINNTTGGYSITAKTASGSGVALGTISQIVGDGTNIYAANPDSVQIVTNVATLRDITPSLSRRIQTRGYYTDGDGGGGQYFPKVGAAPGTYVHNGGTVIVPNGGDGSTAWLLDSPNGIYVRQFGAKGDAVTDDSTPITNAVLAARGIYGTGRTVWFNDGKYLCGDIDVLTTGMTLRGESKFGTWLIAKTGSASILNIGSLSTAARQNVIETMSFDYTNLTSSADNAAIRYKNTYGNALRDVHIEASNDNTTASYALYFGQGCYVTVVENVDAPRVRIYSPTADRPTTLTFINLDFGFVDINNAGSITFNQPVGQSTTVHDFGTYRMSIVNCYSFTAIGGDFEDDDPTHYIYYLDNVTQECISIGNWTSAFAGGYAVYGPTGVTGKRFLQDDKTNGFEYKSGNWTPVLAWSTPGTSTITAGRANGRYVKIGNLVTCSFNFDNATFTNGTANGYLILSGLPFAPKTYPTDMQGGSITLNIGFPTNLQSIQISFDSPLAYFKKSDGAGGNVVVADVSGSGKYVRGTFTYECVN